MILGSGIDLVEVARIERELTRRDGDPLDDLFTPDELAWCRSRPRPAEGYALGFAAKEALVKALGTGLVGRMAWTDMRVDWTGGRPAVTLVGETATAAAAMGVTTVHVSATVSRPGGKISPGDISAPGKYLPEIFREGFRSAEISPGGISVAAAWVVLEGRPDGC